MKVVAVAAAILIVFIISRPSHEYVVVERVVDGDTLVLDDGRKVRLLQIDAPERGECGYERAADYLERTVNVVVRLESDPEFGDTDKYGRLLRYVHMGDVLINADMHQRNLVDDMFYEGKRGKYAYLMNGSGSCK
jgi:endonuclease YncB( thermonuclease family)